MYARYIPPPKSDKTLPRPKSPAAAPSHFQTTAASAPTDGFSYARYVPGAKATQAAAVKRLGDESSPLTCKRSRGLSETQDTRQRGKKLKVGGDQAPSEESSAVQGSKAGAGESKAEAKKKNRRKRKQRTKRTDSDDSEDSGDASTRGEPTQFEVLQAGTPVPSVVLRETTNPETFRDRKQGKFPNAQAERAAKNVVLESARIGVTEANDTAQTSEDASLSQPGKFEDMTTKVTMKKRKPPKSKKAAETGQEQGEEGKEEEAEEAEEEVRHKTVLERKEKSLKLAGKATQDGGSARLEEPAELHGLEPLPQPRVVADDESRPTYNTLPAWLTHPIRASQSSRKAFRELGILAKATRVLEEKGFSGAFAVQTAALPLLLPSSQHRAGDVLISAATGSGKTLAYALPIVRDVSQSVITRLRALVVLPTRELVKQAQEVFEMCSRAYDGEKRKKVRVGIAIGSQPIQVEQQTLVASEFRYDPETFNAIREHGLQAGRRQGCSWTVAEGLDHPGTAGVDAVHPRLGSWEGDVVDFTSKVDVLICTPGRLVEHVEQTAGFSLDYVRWLVVDEADKLLAQNFQGWLELVMDKLRRSTWSARDFPDMAWTGVRKVILSATLTRDLSLSQLELRRPQLVVLDSEGSGQGTEHVLPESLREFAVRVHETSLKPLYLLDLLRGQQMRTALADGDEAVPWKPDGATDADSEDSSSGTDSDISSGSSSGASGPGGGLLSPEGKDAGTKAGGQMSLPRCLIFTKSNESALRLARLLALLDASVATSISTLTSTTRTYIRRKTLRAFAAASSPVRLIIASDLVARGIDIPNLGHVINYDLPPSVAGYVHRVGRTARAGRPGCAWTLLGDEESGWFWGKIAKGQTVRRAQQVERTRIAEMDEVRVTEYEDALAHLGKEALELRRG